MPEIRQSDRIAGVHIVEPSIHGDQRGLFIETYRREWFPNGREMVQGNRSNKQAGALVGLHYHLHQADYWYCPVGTIRVVLHDLRDGGPTDGATECFDISGENHLGVFIPPGQAAVPGKITAFVSIEGAGAFADDITQIDHFIDRGVRLIGPVHAKNNRLASSATGEAVEYGFTEMGKKFCERVYSHGALIDVSHLSDKAFADLVPIAKKYGAPIVATHSNARAVADAPRNLTDAQLRTLGETGGVAGLNFHGPFVARKTKVTMDDVIAQAEHMIAVAGIDHVAIGSDFDGGIKPPKGLEDASTLPALAARLQKKGMSRGDVLKVFSLNALRVLGWRSPAMIQAQVDAAKAKDEERAKAWAAGKGTTPNASPVEATPSNVK